MDKILIVDDEKPINDLIKTSLELVGFSCEQVFDGEAAVAFCKENSVDLIILDVMLPKLSGFEAILELKSTPVIFLSARAGTADRIRGLRLGADDYITKPFDVIELVERVRAVLRRTKSTVTTVKFDDITVDLAARKVFRSGSEIILTPKEFDLLEAFLNNRNLALSRDRLINLVWSFDYEGESRTVDVHVQRLRQKLGLENRLKTVYKTGYRLEI
jgi:DNA-binding response OmpR family regulator